MANSTLTGVGSPLSYQGVSSPQPPNLVVIDRAPVSGTVGKDIKNFRLGDIWIDSTNDIPYMLVDMSANIPTWTSFGGDNTSYVTDSGTATESNNSINVLGGDLINTAGSGDTVTINLDRGTDGQIIIGATGSASAYANVTSSDDSLIITEGPNTLDIITGSEVAIQFDTDSGSAIPSAGIITIAGGSNVTTSGSGSTVTITAATTLFPWTEITDATHQMVVDNGYIANRGTAITFTLPATAAVGDRVAIVGQGSGGWIIAQNADQTIHFNSGDTTTGVGGSLASTVRYNTVEIICTVADTDWVVRNASGNLTIV